MKAEAETTTPKLPVGHDQGSDHLHYHKSQPPRTLLAVYTLDGDDHKIFLHTVGPSL